MKHRSLIAYFTILVLLCSGFVVGARMMGEQGVFLAQGYMMTPAIAALITRLFFYKSHFTDAYLRFGRGRDYLRFWLIGLSITALSYVIYTLLGAIRWDLTGQIFLARLAEQFAASGQNINDTLPPGFTPRIMLWVFFLGGLTVFNIMPGLISGFGEEFGHRGFMFPALYRIRPWIGYLVGGLIWYAWHVPLGLMILQPSDNTIGVNVLNQSILATGSICTFTYLAYVYMRSKSVFVTALAHITMNNAAIAVSYFALVQDQVLANAGLMLTMIIVVAILYFKRSFKPHRLPILQEFASEHVG